jgi:hypothetical protein
MFDENGKYISQNEQIERAIVRATNERNKRKAEQAELPEYEDLDPVTAAYVGLVEQMASYDLDELDDIDEDRANTILLAMDKTSDEFQADIDTMAEIRRNEEKSEREFRAAMDRHMQRAQARAIITQSSY